MDQTITLPYWLFILLALFTLLLILDRVLFPSVRWYLRRRVNRIIKEVNTRLDIEIRPFQLTKKQVLVDQLLFDEKVIEAIKDYAQEQDLPLEIAQAKAQSYANEITPTFNAYVYFRFGYWLAKKVSRLIYRVRVGVYDDDQIKKIEKGSTVVLVMNHRSNMDYVLVSFLIGDKVALSYAVGEWARIWPLQTLIKSMGAFFVRRSSRNTLYRRVLERYVNLATRAGVCQAVFLEGGLTIDGKMREPRLGFMDYMLREYHPSIDRDIVFIPIGINYDRVLEDKSLIRHLDKNAQKRSSWYVLKTALKFFYKTLTKKRKARWSRFGYAGVNFGKPLSAKHYCEQHQIDFSELESTERFEQIKQLADELMQGIEEVVPILPVVLMSEIFLAQDMQWKSELQLKASAMQRIKQLKLLGAPIDLSESAFEQVLSSALTMLVGRRFVEEKDNLYKLVKGAETNLKYYANSISHWQ